VRRSRSMAVSSSLCWRPRRASGPSRPAAARTAQATPAGRRGGKDVANPSALVLMSPMAEGFAEGQILAVPILAAPSCCTVLDMVGAWNSVKNVAVTSDEATNFALLGLVHVDAALGLGSDRGSVVEIVGAKRGNVATGRGDDRIDIQVAGNEASWSNAFIASGAGDDTHRSSPTAARRCGRRMSTDFRSVAAVDAWVTESLPIACLPKPRGRRG
jgi:hypothetical protein